MNWQELQSLIQTDPKQAVQDVSWKVESCSSALKELHEDPDLTENDWLCSDGARLDEFDPDWRKPPDGFDVVYPDLDGIPSVNLRIGEFYHYVPLTHAINMVVGHFEVAAQTAEDLKNVLARGSNERSDELWSYFDSSLEELRRLIDPNLPELTPTKDTVYV